MVGGGAEMVTGVYGAGVTLALMNPVGRVMMESLTRKVRYSQSSPATPS